MPTLIPSIHDSLLIEPGSVRTARNLEALACSRMARLAQGQCKSRDGFAGLREGLLHIADGEQMLEQAFLLAHEFGQEQQGRAARQRTFVEDFCRRLTFAGSDRAPHTWSLAGWIDDRRDQPLALARDRGVVLVGSGIPGSGKTVMSTVLGEGGFPAGLPLTSQELLPTAFVFFHLEENDRMPQLLDGLRPNPNAGDLELLQQRLGVGGRGLSRLRLVVPTWLMEEELGLEQRLAPYRDLGLEVRELRVHLGQIGQPGLEAALGAHSGARFVQRILQDAQQQGRGLRTARMHKFIDEATDLDAGAKDKAHKRVAVLEDIEAEPGEPGLWGLFEPGVATVVYLGGPHMGRSKVSPVLVSLLSGLMMPCAEHGEFQRVIVVDEINLIDKDDPVWRMLVKGGRLARHRAWTLMLLGQDLLCVPDEMFSTVGMCAVFRQCNPKAWEHARDRVGPLRGFRWEDVAHLLPGEAVLTSLLSTDRRQAWRVRFRPPVCMHGGYTRGAI